MSEEWDEVIRLISRTESEVQKAQSDLAEIIKSNKLQGERDDIVILMASQLFGTAILLKKYRDWGTKAEPTSTGETSGKGGEQNET